MFKRKKERGIESTQYATRADYCRIFQEDMNSLYLLSFVLTANHARAVQCYLNGFECAVNGAPVFKEWTRSWCKRSVIQSAIRLVFSDRGQGECDAWPDCSVSSAIKSVARLRQLERFVFVLSVLERYSDRECSILLSCTVQDIFEARLMALRTHAGVAEGMATVSGAIGSQDRLLVSAVKGITK